MRKSGIIFGVIVITAMFMPMASASIHNVNFKDLGGGRNLYGVKIDDRHWYTLMTPGFETSDIAGRYLNPDYLTDDIDHDGKNGYNDFNDRDYYELYSTVDGPTFDRSGVTGALLVQMGSYSKNYGWYSSNIHDALYFRIETMFDDNYHEGDYGSSVYNNWMGSSANNAPAVEIHIDKLRINGDPTDTTNKYSFVEFLTGNGYTYGNNLTYDGYKTNNHPTENWAVDMVEDTASLIPGVGTALTVGDMIYNTYEYLYPPSSFYQNSGIDGNEEAWFKWDPDGYPLFATSINNVVWGINDNVNNGYTQSMGLKIYATFHYVDYTVHHTSNGGFEWDYVNREITTPPVYIYMITPGPNYNTPGVSGYHLGNIAMPLKPILDVSSAYSGDTIHATVKTIDWEVGENIYNGEYGQNVLEYDVDWGDGSHSTATAVSGKPVTLSHTYNTDDTTTYHIKVRAMQENDEYIVSPLSPSASVVIYGSSSGSGGSGGGGGNPPGGGACPFLYTYNGKWEAQNNILVWSENATRRNLETKDYYLFNGNESDGRITIGIGESGNDVDYIDSIKLYKVNVPQGYEVAESYRGKVYAYRDVETGIMKDNTGKNVTSLIGKEDNHYWIGNKGDYVDVFLNLSKRNLLLIRGIDNPPVENKKVNTMVFRPPRTLSTIWIYANKSGEWKKIAEIKVRHNLHTNVMDLSHYIHRHKGKVELRFLMKDRNGLDFVGISHHYRIVHLNRVKLLNSSYGYDKIAKKDGYYLRINSDGFVTMNFKSRGNGMYLLKVYGFYFNKNKIGKGIGIVRENVTNIAEAPLTNSTHSGVNYVLLPLLENYSGISSIIWFVDGYYIGGDKPVISFAAGEQHIELWVVYNSGFEKYYSLYTFSS